MRGFGKTELARRVVAADQTNLTPTGLVHTKYAVAAIEVVLAEIERAVSEGTAVTLKGFGTFKPKHQKARVGRNPRTGEAVEIPERTVLGFTASKHRE